jgi:hypothetical protein
MYVVVRYYILSQERESTDMNLQPLRDALAQQRDYERKHVNGDSITYHLASLYCLPPNWEYLVERFGGKDAQARLEEIWKMFSMAGDIIKRYEDATVALLKSGGEGATPDPFEAVNPFLPPLHLFHKEVAMFWRDEVLLNRVVRVIPVANPTIRVRVLPPPDFRRNLRDDEMPEGTWRHVKLYEYHPDLEGHRMKFRGRAYVEPQLDLLKDGNYRMMGVGFLEEPYMEVRETAIHNADRNALTRWCQFYNNHASLVMRECPLPFPMFTAGARVVVTLLQEGSLCSNPAIIGQPATVTEDSSGGDMTSICFDDQSLNRGTDGKTLFKSVGVPSICLRPLR